MSIVALDANLALGQRATVIAPDGKSIAAWGYDGTVHVLDYQTSPGDLANIRKVMESLMDRKVELFPDDKRQVVSARIVMVGNVYRIETESANL